MTGASPNPEQRAGIACIGNWIVDRVKRIDAWPARGNLANILDERHSTGGAAANVLVDLARLRPGLPLEAIGKVGDDPDGAWILDQIAATGADTSQLRSDPGQRTSYTDVMTEARTGERTFFHYRGANDSLTPADIDVSAIRARHAHLGYLLLLAGLDAPDERFGTGAAKLLADLRAAGIRTSIDVVSAEEADFPAVVRPALTHTDDCIMNEVEAGRVVGARLRSADETPDWPAVRLAADQLAGLGVLRTVTIHLPEGAVALDVATGRVEQVPSLALPGDAVVGTAGAGDAFCAGLLLGLHDGWDLAGAVVLAHGAAAMSLGDPTCSGGVGTAEDALRLTAEQRRPR